MIDLKLQNLIKKKLKFFNVTRYFNISNALL